MIGGNKIMHDFIKEKLWPPQGGISYYDEEFVEVFAILKTR